MIIDASRAMTQTDNPPSYDAAVQNQSGGKGSPPAVHVEDAPLIPVESSNSSVPLRMPVTPVYHYTNAATNEQIVSLLPPDHPEMICLQTGTHVPETKWGILGLLAAVFWFPLGIGICLLDRRVKCSRCGLMIDEGFCR